MKRFCEFNNMANTSSSVKECNVDMAAAMIAALPTLAFLHARWQALRAGPDGRRGQGTGSKNVGALSIRNVRKSFGAANILGRHRHRGRGRRIPDPGRAIRMRQIHAAGDDRRPRRADSGQQSTLATGM